MFDNLSTEPGKALAIGADLETRWSLKTLLKAGQIECIGAPDGGAGLKAFYAHRPDVVVLDLDLPDIDGLEVLAKIRELSDVPIVAVACGEEASDRVRGLRAGADDCVAKPTGRTEMLARIEALLRRPRWPEELPRALEDDFVRVDRAAHRVECLGVPVELTPIEFRMLATFAEHPGRVLGHAQILDLVWGDGVRDRGEVKLYVSYLRRKLGRAANVDPVETVRGVGYRYAPRHCG